MGYVRTSAKKRAKIPRSLDVQSVPAGGVKIPPSSSLRKQSSRSIGGSLEETFAIMFQVYRQMVTHLKSDEGSGVKDEKEQRRECKAESSAPIVAAAALPRWAKLHREKVCSYSILSSIDSSSPSSSASKGLSTSPRSPTRLQPPSTSSTGAGRSRTRAMYVLVIMYLLSILSLIFPRF